MAQLSIEVSDEEHRQFKAACALMGIPMAEVIRRAMVDWINRAEIHERIRAEIAAREEGE